MDVIGYGRADESEVPLKTQRYACQEFCEKEKHSLETWFEDDVPGDTDPLQREGFREVLRYSMNQEIDAILTYQWQQFSTDIAVTTGLRPLLEAAFDSPPKLYTTEGELDFTESEDPRKEILDRAMKGVAENLVEWREVMRKLKIKTSLHELIENGERYRIGRAPYGLETDKQRFDRDRVYEYYPDDRDEEDKFKQAIQIINTFALQNTTPFERETQPTGRGVGREYDINSATVESIWKYQETYRDVAEKHRDDVTIHF